MQDGALCNASVSRADAPVCVLLVCDVTCVLWQEITTLGLPSLFANDSLQFDLVRLVNCTHDLLQKHRTSSRIREELENRCVLGSA